MNFPLLRIAARRPTIFELLDNVTCVTVIDKVKNKIKDKGVPDAEATRSSYPSEASPTSCQVRAHSWRGGLGPSSPGKSLENQCPDAGLSLRLTRRIDA